MRGRTRAGALLLLTLLPVSAAAQGLARRATEFRADFGLGFRGTLHTLAAPAEWSRAQWWALPAAAVGLATLSGVDEPVHRLVDRNRAAAAGDVLDVIEPLGSKGGIATVVGTYLVGLAVESPGLRRAGVEAATSSVLASGIVTPTLKRLVGRSRPWTERGAFDFHAMSGNESFPSGHTTQAFAAASVFAAEARPLWAKAAIYGTAGGVAAARMYHDAHFLSDIVAGAVIGTLTGRAVVHGNAQREHAGAARGERGRGARWAPYAGSEGVGLSLQF